MTDMHAAATLLPPGLAAEVENATGASITGIIPRGGGGASREGAEIALAWPSGRVEQTYMNYDVHRAGASDDAAFLREAAILQALSGPLADAGVRSARFVAAIPDSRALLTARVTGDASFNALRDPDARRVVAADYMKQLAALHAIDVHARPIAGMGEPRPIADLVRKRLNDLNARVGGDPLIALTLKWLAANVPAEPDRLVIVHGDAGPGNFLFADGAVTALLDWELVHYGDPMADLAMIWLRDVIQPFVPMPDAFAAYRAAGGAPIDEARMRFWEVFFRVGFVVGGRFDDPSAPIPPNLGTTLIYGRLNRRVLAESLAAAAGVALPEVALPEAPPSPRARTFALALDDLRDVIVPRVADQQASAKAKGLARLVKWWRDAERYGPSYDARTVQELSAALGSPVSTAAEGRAMLVAALETDEVDTATAIRLCHADATRDAALMADAMGGLAKAKLAPLR